MGKVQKSGAEDLYVILAQIEEQRSLMNNAAAESGLSDPAVIEMSQRLDDLLNRYQQFRALVESPLPQDLFPGIEKGRAANAALI